MRPSLRGSRPSLRGSRETTSAKEVWLRDLAGASALTFDVAIDAVTLWRTIRAVENGPL